MTTEINFRDLVKYFDRKYSNLSVEFRLKAALKAMGWA